MSRAFVKDDQDNDPVVVPQRAPLPDGVPNLVTPSGLAALERERADLEAERDDLQNDLDAPDAVRRLAALAERLDALGERLRSAELVPPPDGPGDEVTFGATVTLRTVGGKSAGEEMVFRIVGVDEADPLEGRVAFTAPTARALLGRRVGERVRIGAGRGEREAEIEGVEFGTEYEGDDAPEPR